MLNQELSGGANSDPKPAVRTIVLSSGSQRRPHEVLFELTLRIHMPKKADQHTAQADAAWQTKISSIGRLLDGQLRRCRSLSEFVLVTSSLPGPRQCLISVVIERHTPTARVDNVFRSWTSLVSTLVGADNLVEHILQDAWVGMKNGTRLLCSAHVSPSETTAEAVDARKALVLAEGGLILSVSSTRSHLPPPDAI